MDEATARDLVGLIGEALATAAECRMKLAAFERVLGAHNPSVTAAWRKEFEDMKRQAAGGANAAALAALRDRLRQG